MGEVFTLTGVELTYNELHTLKVQVMSSDTCLHLQAQSAPPHSPVRALFCFFGDGAAIQASHSLLPPLPPALNLSQHQGLFQ